MLGEINVPAGASEEEIELALLSEIDFDYVRENVEKLRTIVKKFGPFQEILEKTEKSKLNEFTRTVNNDSGNWVLNGLEKLDTSKVWTERWHPYHNYSWIVSGYEKTQKKDQSYVKSWYISEKEIPSNEKISGDTEYQINIFDDDSDYSENYRVISVWELIDIEDLSDQVIINNLIS